MASVRVWHADDAPRRTGTRAQQRPGGPSSHGGPSSRGGNKKKYKPPRRDVLAVWRAEDGRCECCGRPMDRRCAKVSRRVKPGTWIGGNLALLCFDCDSRYMPGQTILSTRRPADEVVSALPVKPGYDRWQVLRALLLKYGIYIPHNRDHTGKKRRRIWVPRLCRVTLRRVPSPPSARPAEWEITSLHVWPEGRLAGPQPQKRTRGLPKPDRSRWRRDR